MYNKIYKVNGQDDIDDYMVMENEAYFKYSNLIMKELFNENIARLFKVKNLLNISFIITEQFVYKKRDLFFTNLFTIKIHVLDFNINSREILIKSDFYNANNQLCTIVKSNLLWNNVTEIDVN